GAVKTGRQAPAKPLGLDSSKHTAPGLGRLGRVLMANLEISSMMEHGPGDAGELIRKCNGKLVVMKPLGRSLNPALQTVTLPAYSLEQHHTGGLHEQHAQILVSTLGDLAQDGAAPGRELLWHDAEPRAEIAAFGKEVAGVDGGNRGAGNKGTDAGHGHQPRAGGPVPRHPFDST